MPELLTRRAPVAKSTWDPETRTGEAVISTYAKVRRHFGIEYLPPDADWDVSRVDSAGGMPVCENHDINRKIGQVISLTRTAKEITIRYKLRRTKDAEAYVRDREDGIATAVSIGYDVPEWTRKQSEDDEDVFVARKIELLEVSFVTVGADPAAHVRSSPMPNPLENAPDLEPGDDDLTSLPTRRRNTRQRVEDAVEAERQRILDLEAIGVRHDVDRATVRRAIATGTSIRAFNQLVLDQQAERFERSPHPGYPDHNSTTLDNPGVRVRAMAEALHARVQPGAELSGQAQQFAGLTIAEFARKCLEFRGERTVGMGPATLIRAAFNSTSDFPLLLGDTVNRTLRAAYEAVPSEIKKMGRKTTARDFRMKYALTFEGVPRLRKVNEHGEYESGSFHEGREGYRIATYGRIFGITRQALINDDLSAFDQVPRKLGQEAESFQARFLVDLLQANSGGGPKMADGKNLFHNDHKNYTSTGTALSATSLDAAMLAMNAQTDLRGEPITVQPKYLLVGPKLAFTAKQLFGTFAPATASDVNPFKEDLVPIVEPRLGDTFNWWLSAPTSQIDGLEYCYLEGEEGPQLDTEHGFDIDGIRIKVRLDFGAGFVDHRGWYKNNGAAPAP